MDSFGSRTEAFAGGANGGGAGMHAATSIQQNVDPAFSPFSAGIGGAALLPSANGLGTSDAGRRTVSGSMLPTQNGQSSSTYAAQTGLNPQRNL